MELPKIDAAYLYGEGEVDAVEVDSDRQFALEQAVRLAPEGTGPSYVLTIADKFYDWLTQ